MADSDRLLASIASEQYGVFTQQQAIAAGIKPRSIGDRTARGTYERLFPRVYGIAGSADGWYRSVLAAVFAATDPAAASHRTAAYLWALTDRRPEVIEVVSRRHLRVKRERYRVRESKDLRSSDIVAVDGIPTTTAVRTVVDLGASAAPWFVEKCLDTGLRTQLFTAWDVHRFIARVARRGRTGIGTIRPMVEDRLTWAGITDSDLEDLFRRVVAPTPYPMPEPQYTLFERADGCVGRFDFAYPTRMALIETDSEGYHMDPVSFQRDREKQNRAHALGWTVYRFTWRQLIDGPESVRDIIGSIWTD